MKGQKINKKSNAVMAVICLVIGLALTAGGIYLIASGEDAATGGGMTGLGALIIVLFGCAMYLIVNFEKLQKKAEEKAEREAAARRVARREAAEAMRATQDPNGNASGGCASENGTASEGAESADSTENEVKNG